MKCNLELNFLCIGPPSSEKSHESVTKTPKPQEHALFAEWLIQQQSWLDDQDFKSQQISKFCPNISKTPYIADEAKTSPVLALDGLSEPTKDFLSHEESMDVRKAVLKRWTLTETWFPIITPGLGNKCTAFTCLHICFTAALSTVCTSGNSCLFLRKEKAVMCLH